MTVHMDDDEIRDTFVLSGYALTPSHFRSLVGSLCFPNPPSGHRSPRRHYMDYVIAYDSWRRKLQPEIISKVPELICLYRDSSNKPIRYYFFTRFVPFKDEEQLNPTGIHDHLWHPTEKDEQRLRAFKRLIESRGGTFDIKKLEFGCIKRVMYMSMRKWKEIFNHNV
ncbi:hypothetical protein D9757_006911 [Collybiopsis confluens]|uniref:Uncharacterized protein n=1 Tax=Collybiopsis confluens TaxID=2823264 RepID=A0A8H5M7R7_9AGAR|nr:hypothetical protein D9757_006911 [Collybiopsis confluens]